MSGKDYIREGTLDLFITKPVNLQFITTLRNIDFGASVPNMIAGVIIVIVGWQKTGVEVSIQNILGYTGFIFSGVIVTYAIMLIPQLLCFWIIKGDSLIQ